MQLLAEYTARPLLSGTRIQERGGGIKLITEEEEESRSDVTVVAYRTCLSRSLSCPSVICLLFCVVCCCDYNLYPRPSIGG